MPVDQPYTDAWRAYCEEHPSGSMQFVVDGGAPGVWQAFTDTRAEAREALQRHKRQYHRRRKGA